MNKFKTAKSRTERNSMATITKQMDLGGRFVLPGTAMTLNRIGYGAMQLAGPGGVGTTA